MDKLFAPCLRIYRPYISTETGTMDKMLAHYSDLLYLQIHTKLASDFTKYSRCSADDFSVHNVEGWFTQKVLVGTLNNVFVGRKSATT